MTKLIKGSRMFLILVVLMAAVFMFIDSSALQAVEMPAAETEATVETSETETTSGDLTPMESFVYSYLETWQDLVVVSEYRFDETIVLQLYLMVTTLDDLEVDMAGFSESLFVMMDELSFEHTRVYLDIVNHAGERLESYDFLLSDKTYEMAVFESENGVDGEEELPDPMTAVEAGLNQPFAVGETEIVITFKDVYDDMGAPYLLLTFNFTNNKDYAESANMAIDFSAEQNGVPLERHVRLGDVDTTMALVEPGGVMANCVLGFYLASDTEPVTVQFSEFLGDDVVTFVADIGGS